MSGNNITALLDSNILIYASKSLLNIRELLEPYQNVYISSITYMEVLGYKFENRKLKKLTEKLIENFEVIHTNNEIINTVVEYRQKSNIKLPDAIILATASILKDTDLITNNINDFKEIDDTVKICVPKIA